VIVQPAAFLSLLVEETLLLLGQIQAIRERLTHFCILWLRHTSCQGEQSILPRLEAAAL
jgi:hypothetical protein